jgi:hypothetical protein
VSLSGVSYDPRYAYSVNDLEDAVPMYIGKAKSDGKWMIQKYNSSTGNMSYANITNNTSIPDYATAWAGRAGLVYGAFQTLEGV